MADLKFRDLRADEIDVRIATVKEKGMSLLLYKDARCDMNILDETVGAYNWQRTHSRDNANCTVSIWDSEKSQWISKEDVGTESNTEAQKGLASDSFKRACFNWGIGRELYTAPFIWIGAGKYKDKYDKFSVAEISIKDKKITALSIMNDTTGSIVFTMGKVGKKKTAQPVEPVAPVEEPELPFEVLPDEPPKKTNRDKFREFTADWDKTIKAKIIKECGLTNDSPDEAWQPALMRAIAVKAGATI